MADDNQGELKVEIISSQRNEQNKEWNSKAKTYHLEHLYHSWKSGKDNKYHRRIMHLREQNGAIVNIVACIQCVYEKEVQVAAKLQRFQKW